MKLSKLGNEKNWHFEQTEDERELADSRADLQRKYQDPYSSQYTTPAAIKYRIKKIIETKIEPMSRYKNCAVVTGGERGKQTKEEILKDLEDIWG